MTSLPLSKHHAVSHAIIVNRSLLLVVSPVSPLFAVSSTGRLNRALKYMPLDHVTANKH